MVELGGIAHCDGKSLVLAVLLGVLRILRDLDAEPLGQITHRFREGPAIDLHQERVDVPPLATGEAAIDPLDRLDGE